MRGRGKDQKPKHQNTKVAGWRRIGVGGGGYTTHKHAPIVLGEAVTKNLVPAVRMDEMI